MTQVVRKPSAAREVSDEDFLSLPFFTLGALGVPVPGPSFREHAESLCLGDTGLELLHRRALYSSTFCLPVFVKGVARQARFLPGHTWWADLEAPGPRQRSRVMVVGKMPGIEEVRQGKNFCGPSGQLLLDTLVKAGVLKADLAHWYVTNVLRHDNLDPAQPGKLPKAWLQNCRTLLAQELRLVRPDYVLALGQEATQALLPDYKGKFTHTIGRTFTQKVQVAATGQDADYHQFSVFPCVHPAFVLRTSARMPEFVGYIKRFADLLNNSTASATPSEDVRVVYAADHLREIVDAIIEDHSRSGEKSQPIAIDCEWHGNSWVDCHKPRTVDEAGRIVNPNKLEPASWLRTIQLSHKDGFACVVVLRQGGLRNPDGTDLTGVSAFSPSIDAVVPELQRLFRSTDDRQVRLVGHNLRADLPWLLQLDEGFGNQLVGMFAPPEDDENADGETHLFGWQKARHCGGFDTMYAAHAVEETAEKKLEIVAMRACGRERYDGPVVEARKKLATLLKIPESDLPGYGELAAEVLFPYGARDVMATIQLFRRYTEAGGLLDADANKQSSWLAWWQSQRALTAELEMEMTGLQLDRQRADALTALYVEESVNRTQDLRALLRWPGFNLQSVYQVRTVLFGPAMAGKEDKETGGWADVRPEEAKSCLLLNLTPVKASGKSGLVWEKVVARREERFYAPATDQESVGILLARALQQKNTDAVEVLRRIRATKSVSSVLSKVLQPPDRVKNVVRDEDGNIVREKGILACIHSDGRVRTRYLPVETGRVSSSDPNLQNIANRKEAELAKILGDRYRHPLRSIFVASPGHILVESDFTGAELLMMALQSGSNTMCDHCSRSLLPESDSNHYDIHSRVAVAAFGLTCDPTKTGLKNAGFAHYRDLAKTIAFGLAYGRGDEAVVRALEELNIRITLAEVDKIRAVLFTNYPELESFFDRCRRRVTDPGWIRTCFGRLRRFSATKETQAELERAAMNFPIQSGVADGLRHALYNLRHYPNRRNAAGQWRYKLVLQVHDAAMAEVRIEDVAWYRTEVLPKCFSVPVYACDLDGNRLPGRKPYSMGFEAKYFQNWGEALKPKELKDRFGICDEG